MKTIACYLLQNNVKLSQISKEMVEMKTISIRLEDSIYEELGVMLEAMGQTKQTFYETFTRTALRERSSEFPCSSRDKCRGL